MKSIIEKIIKFDVLNVIGIYIENQKDVFSLLRVKRVKDKLEVVNVLSFFSLNDLTEDLDKSIPLVLLIDGKSVLNKKIDSSDKSDLTWLKNLDYNNLYFNSYKTEQYEYFSFCRKKTIDNYLDNLKQRNITILNLYIGTSVAILMKNFFGENDYFANNTYFKIIGSSVIEFKKINREEITNSNYIVDQETITNYHIPLYAAAINFFVNSNSFYSNEPKLEDKEEFLYKKAFEKTGIFILVFFLLTLIVSYFSIQYYISKNAELSLLNKYYGKTYNEIKILEDKFNSKMKIFDETGFSARKYMSFYCYEITYSTPLEINLSSVEFNPVLKEIKKASKVDLEYNTIAIEGVTFTKTALNDWIDYLKTKKWIGLLQVIFIKKDKKEAIFFEIKIKIKNV